MEESACDVVQKRLACVQKYMEAISDSVLETLVRDGVNPDVASSCLKLVMAFVEKSARLETELKLRGNALNRGNVNNGGMAAPAAMTYGSNSIALSLWQTTVKS